MLVLSLSVAMCYQPTSLTELLPLLVLLVLNSMIFRIRGKGYHAAIANLNSGETSLRLFVLDIW